MHPIHRRAFLLGGLSAGIAPASSHAPEGIAYRFAVGNCDLRLNIEFYDQYAAKGFWFNERSTNSEFCLSGSGKPNKNCLSNFHGSLAIAHYRMKGLPGAMLAIRERVRTIDQDSRLDVRAPFEERLEVRDGRASDIQAFGYEGESPASPADSVHDPWCLLRQDLYFDGDNAPFLVLHWKHSLSAVRLLDLIPGAQTRSLD